MGSFFVIQVHTGFEIEVKEMLQNLLEKGNNQTVKCIYAMEKATAIFWKGNELDSLCELSSKEISENRKIFTQSVCKRG
ncbi:hypothetical protein ACA29_02745 [Lederbergia galactosidilytica]|uniref:Uncharacterized protein n=1 Tax=Lederbergia galactosidilytica TaxID=217031 RepID=A0A0Q9YG48_9BACI|nr:hypothetical protein ACA29_02745 [Lederbergia galactosidilytica]